MCTAISSAPITVGSSTKINGTVLLEIHSALSNMVFFDVELKEKTDLEIIRKNFFYKTTNLQPVYLVCINSTGNKSKCINRELVT